jgi:tRNA pseudouridine55 synthase
MYSFENKLFVINKASGPTSFDVVDAFRKASRVRKVGHTGTLDPLAEGVLLLCTGTATRVVEHFMNLGKVYEFEVRLGVGTETLDAEGEITSQVPCPEIPDREIRAVASDFVGECRIDPPAYSALRRGGKRLYELARAGEKPRVESRSVRIHELDVVRIELPVVHFRMRCSRGTYVRSLARDFGARFGLPAHVQRLVRTAVGPFRIEHAYPSGQFLEGELHDLKGIDLADALEFLPGIVISERASRGLLDGTLPDERDVVRTIGAASAANALRILDESGELLAVGTRASGSARKLRNRVDSYRLLTNRRS